MYHFKDLFESIPDYRKIVFVMIYLKIDDAFSEECGFLKNDINSLNKEFENIIIEQNEENLSYIKNEEESLIARVLNK